MRPGRLSLAAALAALLLSSAVPPAGAQQTAPAAQSETEGPAAEVFRVAIIDIPAILRQASAAQALQRRMQVEQDRYQSRADELQRQLQEEEAAIEQQRNSLSNEAFTQKRREFQDRVNRTTADFRQRRRLIDQAFNEASAEINRTLLAVIEELAVQQGISLVVRREAVLYQSDVFDLTEEAGRALNERLPEVAVAIPPEAP